MPISARFGGHLPPIGCNRARWPLEEKLFIIKYLTEAVRGASRRACDKKTYLEEFRELEHYRINRIMMQPKLQHCEERMKKLNLEILSLDELWQLHEELNQLLSVRLNAEKRALERRLAQLRRENEAANAPTVPAERKRRPYPQVHPKYRNINAPYETWSGRGKQPKWLTAALRTGRSIDDFLISRG